MENINEVTSLKVKELKDTLPLKVLEKHFDKQPKLKEIYTERHIKLYLEDTAYHLIYLAESIISNEQVLFNEYLAWIKTFFENLPVTDDDIIHNLEIIRDELIINLPEQSSALTSKVINTGIDFYKKKTAASVTYLQESNPLFNLATEYLNYLLVGDKDSALNLIMNSVKSNISIKDLYLNVFQVTQKETGRLWQIQKINVAQEHFITASTQLIISQLYPYIFSNVKKEKTILVTCVNGEMHELPARMVADLFELEGWNSHYLGANTPKESIVASLDIYKPQILAISATMTFNINYVRDLINNIKVINGNNKIKIIVGGYPFNLATNLWKKIGADGFAPDALSAILLADNLIK